MCGGLRKRQQTAPEVPHEPEVRDVSVGRGGEKGAWGISPPEPKICVSQQEERGVGGVCVFIVKAKAWL